MADEVQWYSVPAVARMLGISERAIRGRIERGSLTAELTDGQWRIPISALPKNNDRGGTSGGTLGGTLRGMSDDAGGMGGTSDGMDTASLIDARQQAQADAVLQRVLAPFIEQLTATNQELGQVRAERDAAIAERDRLQAAYDAAEASIRRNVPQDTEIRPEKLESPHTAANHAERGFWQRLFGFS